MTSENAIGELHRSAAPVVVVANDAVLARSVGDELARLVGSGDTSQGWSNDGGATQSLEEMLSAAGVVTAAPTDLASVEVRRRVRECANVVWVRPGDPGAEQGRPEDLAVLSTAAEMIEEVSDATGTSPAEAARRVVGALEHAPDRKETVLTRQAMVFGDGRQTDIVVGRGAAHQLRDFIDERCRRVAIVTQPGIDVTVDSGVEQKIFEVPPGEAAKRMDVVADLASQFARWGMTRADMVVAVGGGVVTDLGGFVAASYHRGISVIHVATTLLGQIDAAIGGKCGVNLPEGKNLVGAFWQPRAVLCEIDSLDTLPTREFTSGMGELAKYHFLGGGHLDRVPLTPRVARSAAIKADVVTGDEREGGRRAILNYGHTLAHALETAGEYDLRHGEAVGIGLVYAAELAKRLGRIDDDRVAEHRRVVRGYGLSTRIPDGYDLDQLVKLFSRDKKAVAGITFVLDGPNGVEPVPVADSTLLRETLDAVT